MDISAFSAPSFDVKEWINKAYRSADAQQNPEAFVTSIVAKLQLYVQQVNGALEETSYEVLQNLPRVMHDAEVIHKEALLLRDKMRSVKEEIAKIERDTAVSMETLERLDRMKSQLQDEKQALHEADNWTVLANDIEDVFESHNIDAIASKVESMKQSLVVLANSGDFEDRQLQLESFKNRLEAIASPLLVKAFTNKSIEESKKYVKIFSGMDRLPQLLKYFAKCEKATLCQQWNNVTELDQDHGIQEWLSTFYDHLLSNWQFHVKWCHQVFGTSDMLAGIYGDVLKSLEPTLVMCIEMTLKQQSDQLGFLMGLKETTQHFSDALWSAYSQQGGRAHDDGWKCLKKSMFCMYTLYVSQYGSLEESHIVSRMEEWNVKKEDAMDAVHTLGQSTSKLMAILRGSVDRCFVFTSGTAFPGLLSAVEFSLVKHLEFSRCVLRIIEVEKQQSKEEWDLFQTCLSLLQSISEFQNDVDKLNQELFKALKDIAQRNTSPETEMKSILLTKTSMEDYNKVASLLNQDDVNLLGSVKGKLDKVSSRVFQTTLEVMFGPISVQLCEAHSAWDALSNISSQQPDYSYAPLEYITQIGEYLMTLPQHLEPFLMKEDKGDSAADILLSKVAKRTCSTYADLLLSMQDLSPNAAKQLSIDIFYLGNVLEDLGLSLTEPLLQIGTLLKIPSESFQTQSAGCPAKLVSTIRQIRNIPSS